MSSRRAMSYAKGMMRAVVSNGRGGVDVVHRNIPVPRAGECLVRVAAAGVNRADLLQASRKYPPPPGSSDILGLECSGFRENGQYIAALLTGGGFAEYAAVPESAIIKFPATVTATLSAVQLAAIPEAFGAAYHFLFQKGNFSAGEAVLINTAASGVGTSAIQLAKTIPDAQIIACAGSQEKLHLCASLGARHTINYTNQRIAEEVQHLTNGRGVDLVLDCVGADQFKDNEKSLKKGGRWVIYGLLSGHKSTHVGLAGIVSKHITVMGTTLRSRSDEYRGALIRDFSRSFAASFAENGELRPIVHKTFSGLESVGNALQYLGSSKNAGKVVVEL